MRDDQVHRYARHIQLPEIGGLGQTAILVATAHMPLREPDPRAELIAGTYLAACGVGGLVVPNASANQRDDLAAHGPDTRVTTSGQGRDVTFLPVPAWWPAAADDGEAVAFYRGGLAAAAWLVDAASR